jgi:hypothetical protein
LDLLALLKRALCPPIRHGSLTLAAAALFSLPAASFAGMSSDEPTLKAAFVYNFAKFVDWPESALRGRREFCIGTIGHNPLEKELAALSGKTVNGRSIVFHRFSTPEQAADCNVLFLSRSDQARAEAILETLADRPILTVGDYGDFCGKGGMFAVEKRDARLVFDVNLAQAQRAGLRPHSQLLKLARKIYGKP